MALTQQQIADQATELAEAEFFPLGTYVYDATLEQELTFEESKALTIAMREAAIAAGRANLEARR